MDIDKLVRPNIRNLKPYSSAREIHSGMNGIFLDANENALEPVYGVGLNRYPDPLQHHVKTKLSQLKQVPAEQIFLGNGSDEPIDLLIRAFCEPGRDEILIPSPTYGMYQVCADINNVGVKQVDLSESFALQVDAMLEAISDHTKLIFLCSPNNPTGNLLEKAGIRKIAGRFKGLVVIDEAYVDFAEEPGWLPEREQYENMVILQTFSKAWGMAASRVGMAFAGSAIIGILNRIKYPYNVNGLSQEAVLNALDYSEKKTYLVNRILEEKKWLYDELSRLKSVETIFHSDANFLLVRFKDARQIYREMLKKHILLRDRSNHPLTRNCLRITVGSPEENKILINYLKERDI